jgi:DNA modification methylase
LSVKDRESEAAAIWVPVEDLRPWKDNPRLNDGAVDKVAASIKRFGFGSPIIARKADHEVIAGHTRLKAAIKLGLRQVPVRFVDLDPADAHLLALADNKTAEIAEWDEEQLGKILDELRGQDVDLIDGTGFTDAEICKLLDGAHAGGTGEDPGAGEPPLTPVSKPGEIYELGPHRLMCGDSTNGEHVRLLMNGERAVLCATDPPYLVDYDGTNHPQSFDREQAGKDNNKNWDSYRDPKASIEFFSKFIRAAIAEALVEAPAFYHWHALKRQSLVEAAWTENKLLLHQQLVWVKARPILTRSHFMWRHEPCFYGWIEGRPPALRPPVGGECTTIWNIDQVGEQDGIHPTQKPLEIFERPISYHTKRSDVVYEPFSGSGSQIIAAAKLGRRCYAMELEPAFVDVARIRWTQFARSAGVDPGPGALE